MNLLEDFIDDVDSIAPRFLLVAGSMPTSSKIFLKSPYYILHD